MPPADPKDRAPRLRSSAALALPRTTRPSPGGFELLGELGRGGMGVVYKARQTALNRLVALKMVLGGHYAKDADRLRFLAEAEAVASVRHPNVVQVYEFGYSDGQPYFAMEYLDGGSLARLLAEDGRLPPSDSARIVEQVARGVQAAHDVGLIHRDLKPGNILFAGPELTPSGSALPRAPGSPPPPLAPWPKVTDFGLAKRATGENLTLTGIAMGTPAYMAPEQAAGQARIVGPPADVYALGSILYECLTGRTPFTGTDSGAILTRLANDDPAPLRAFVKDIPADLELICLKCLAKLPGERYHSAAALADDLARFLTGEPVSVRPAGQVEKAVKWVRRYPTRAIAYGLTLLTSALIGLTAGALKLYREGDNARRYAEGARAAAEGQKAGADAAEKAAVAAKAEAVAARDQLALVSAARTIDLAHREAESNNVVQARKLLDDTPANLRMLEWRLIDSSLRREVACLKTGVAAVLGVAFTPDSGRVTFAGLKGVSDWNPDGGAATVVSADSTTVFAVSGDGSRIAVHGKRVTHVIDRATGAVAATLPHAFNFQALNRDGTKLLRVETGDVMLWDVATAKPTRPPTHDVEAWAVAFGPDDQTFAVGGVGRSVPGAPPNLTGSPTPNSPGVVKVFSSTRPSVVYPVYPDAAVRSVAFAPDGRRLAVGCEDGTAVIRDLTGPGQKRFRGHTARVNSVAFSPDGKRLATGSFDRTVRVWDIETGVCSHLWKGHTLAVSAVAFSPDGKRVASAGHDGAVRTWDATAVPDSVRLVGARSAHIPYAVTITDDGSRVFLSAGVSPVQAFDARTGQKAWPAEKLAPHLLRALWLTPDGKTVRTADEDGHVREWDAATGEAMPPGETLAAKRLMRYSANLTRAVQGENGLRNLATYDAKTGAKLATTAEHVGGNSFPAISPDGRRVASMGVLDRTVRVWDTDTGKELFACEGHIGTPTATAFSPDGTRLASVADDGWVKLWDAATGKETLTLRCPTTKLVAVGFSPGGNKLVVTDADGVAHIRDAGPLK